VPRSFVGLAANVACHRDPQRWALLYRILWRIVRQGERHLPAHATDPDISRARTMEKNVRREVHKMHAFVRFRKIGEDPTGRERFVAWFEPEHFIVELAAPFFRKRFANMDWSIFTPKGCVHWNGEELAFSEGIDHDPSHRRDELEAAWRTYYRSIFNPARLKPKMMQTEMAKRYWKNLPEAEIIDDLLHRGRPQTHGMLERTPLPAKKAPNLPYLAKLGQLSQAPTSDLAPEALPWPQAAAHLQACRRCPLWERATQAVPGEGPADASILIVGEQPGDREDLAGRPFVGPAGKLLDEALATAGIERSAIYLTNAVKHFKWTPRGKQRLHQNPSVGEIDACRPWLLAEMAHVAPKVLILLGATAGRAVLGRPVKVTQERGLVPHDAVRIVLTVHPSHLLRITDRREAGAATAQFIADLRLAIADPGAGEMGS
jgi:DNA polymerase